MIQGKLDLRSDEDFGELNDKLITRQWIELFPYKKRSMTFDRELGKLSNDSVQLDES